MKLVGTVIVLFCWTTNLIQISALEKQAVTAVQNAIVSSLDKDSPNSPFGLWFANLVGPKAGVVWQLTECGEITSGEKDIPACIEANALLPDQRKVIVLINVGTFRKGLNAKLTFFNGVVEKDDQLYQVTRLNDLPNMILNPKHASVELPDVNQNTSKLTASINDSPTSVINISAPSLSGPSDEAPPAPTIPPVGAETGAISNTPPTDSKGVSAQSLQKVSEGVLKGRAVFKVKPNYPMLAKSRNISGTVLVQIIIKEDGRVKSAKAISGHPALRGAAEEAAAQWVFTPTRLSGQPVSLESSLTFIFDTSIRR